MDITKKYEFTGETLLFEGRVLKRIRYLNRIENLSYFVTKGTLGGWIEGEHNLSHEGQCTILGESKVFGNARIVDDATISGHAIVKDNTIIQDNSVIIDYAVVGGDTIVGGLSMICDHSSVFFFANPTDPFYGEPNVKNSKIIGYSVVEATGRIVDSHVKHEELSGTLTRYND